MICYLDKTFCSAYRSTCANSNCHRAFTEEVEKAANEWWKDCKGEPPVAFSDLSRDCEHMVPEHSDDCALGLGTDHCSCWVGCGEES